MRGALAQDAYDASTSMPGDRGQLFPDQFSVPPNPQRSARSPEAHRSSPPSSAIVSRSYRQLSKTMAPPFHARSKRRAVPSY